MPPHGVNNICYMAAPTPCLRRADKDDGVDNIAGNVNTVVDGNVEANTMDGGAGGDDDDDDQDDEDCKIDT